MVRPRSRILAPLALAAAVVAATVAPAMMYQTAPVPKLIVQPCVDTVVPGNPYISTCNLQQRGPRVRGQAPDAAAIIACRSIPGCLAYYVNYPGATIWDPPIPRG